MIRSPKAGQTHSSRSLASGSANLETVGKKDDTAEFIQDLAEDVPPPKDLATVKATADVKEANSPPTGQDDRRRAKRRVRARCPRA